MRPLVVAVVAAVAGPCTVAAAGPLAGQGLSVETVTIAGAMLSGLARDDGALLATDLASGRILRREGDGESAPIGPAFAVGPDIIGDPTGPYRVARWGDELIVAQGWTPVDSEPGPLDHALVAVDGAGGARVIANDFWNPFDFVVDGERIYVVDAAANAIEVVDADGGRRQLFAFGRLAGEAGGMRVLSPTEFRGTETYEVDAVPTGIALGDDGRLYVALFGGFPFLAGAGRVVSVATTGDPAPRVEADRLNAPVALAFDFDGSLLVLEHGTYDQSIGFVEGSGRLLAVDRAGTISHVLLDRLTRPADVLVWAPGEYVVSDLGGHLHFLTGIAE